MRSARAAPWGGGSPPWTHPPQATCGDALRPRRARAGRLRVRYIAQPHGQLALRGAQGARVPRALWRPRLQAAGAARAGRPRAGPGRGAGAAAAAPAARARAAAVHAAVLAGAAGAPGSGWSAPCTPAHVDGAQSACLSAGTVHVSGGVVGGAASGARRSTRIAVLPVADCCAAHPRAAARPQSRPALARTLHAAAPQRGRAGKCCTCGPAHGC
jgi:hypothetical protein